MKFFYMKIVGLLWVIGGFSYSLTSFYSFYDYLFGNVSIANGNIIIMSLGLIIPLYSFIFGVYFYFYTDKFIEKVNPYILISSIVTLSFGILRIFFENGIMVFIQESFSIVIIILSLFIIYGCVRYKY